MNRNVITIPKKLVYRIIVGLALIVVLLILALKFNLIHFQNAAKDQQGAASPMVGEQAPDFTLETLDENRFSLTDVAGRPVLMNFWASWCAPCREETPYLVQAYNSHRAKGLLVLGVNLTAQDALPDIKAFVTEFQMPYPILLDSDSAVANLYRVQGLPTSFFINRLGKITHVQIGKLTPEQIQQYLAEILPETH